MLGCIAGAKAHVNDFISTFDMFSFLWKQDLATEYAAFMVTHPTLEVRFGANNALRSSLTEELGCASLLDFLQASIC